MPIFFLGTPRHLAPRGEVSGVGRGVIETVLALLSSSRNAKSLRHPGRPAIRAEQISASTQPCVSAAPVGAASPRPTTHARRFPASRSQPPLVAPSPVPWLLWGMCVDFAVKPQ